MNLVSVIYLLLVNLGGALECRNAAAMDDTCTLEVAPGQSVLTIPGVTKFCGMMFASHVYASHYETVKTEIHAFCSATNDTYCCPTATLGIVSRKECLQTEGSPLYKSCESGSSVGKPDISGQFNSWVPYSLNSAGSKELKLFFGCDPYCAPKIIEGLEGYVAGSGSDALVAKLLEEFKGNMSADIPSLYPKQSRYQGTTYCGDCNSNTENNANQDLICRCRLNATTDKPSFCSINFPLLESTQTVTPTPTGACPSPGGTSGNTDNIGNIDNTDNTTGSGSGYYAGTTRGGVVTAIAIAGAIACASIV